MSTSTCNTADVNSLDSFERHREIIHQNPVLKLVYDTWYKEFESTYEMAKKMDGLLVELGSGAGFIEKYFPGVLKCDVIPHPTIDRIEDACAMSFASESVAGFFMLNAFHHLPNPELFLSELARVLRVGGRAVIIEPTYSFHYAWVVKQFHPHESWDHSIKDWKNHPTGRLTGANNALAWVVFERDRKVFEERFPSLKIKAIRRHTPFGYLLSGGLSFPCPFPAWFVPLIGWLEGWVSRYLPMLCSFMTIEFEKLAE